MGLTSGHPRPQEPGPRVLVYLDQSTLSALVLEARFASLREQLRTAVNEGLLVCSGSLEHTSETMPASTSWEAITRLGRELSMGIDFRDEQMLRTYEVLTAAEIFFEGRSRREVWEEAFETDPHTPRERLLSGGFQVHAYFPPDEQRLAEVENLRQTELDLKRIYDETRRQGYAFEQQVEREFDAMVDWALGPLVDGGKMETLVEQSKQALVGEWLRGGFDMSPGSRLTVHLARAEQLDRVRALTERFPELTDRAAEFAASTEFRTMQALRIRRFSAQLLRSCRDVSHNAATVTTSST